MIETLAIVGISALGIAMIAHSRHAAKERRAAIEKATGGRYSDGVTGQTLELERKGLPLSVRFNESGGSEHDQTASVSIPVSLSPQAEFWVGPKNPFEKPVGSILTGLPELEADLPWLAGLQVRGEPEKAALEVLSRVQSLDEFRRAGLKPQQLACRKSRLELVFSIRGSFGADDLKRLTELSADLAFRLMG